MFISGPSVLSSEILKLIQHVAQQTHYKRRKRDNSRLKVMTSKSIRNQSNTNRKSL